MSGFFTLVSLILFQLSLFLSLEHWGWVASHAWVYSAMMIPLTIVVIFMILVGPLALIITLIGSGFNLLRHEGFNFRNLLSLAGGLFLLFYSFLIFPCYLTCRMTPGYTLFFLPSMFLSFTCSA